MLDGLRPKGGSQRAGFASRLARWACGGCTHAANPALAQGRRGGLVEAQAQAQPGGQEVAVVDGACGQVVEEVHVFVGKGQVVGGAHPRGGAKGDEEAVAQEHEAAGFAGVGGAVLADVKGAEEGAAFGLADGVEGELGFAVGGAEVAEEGGGVAGEALDAGEGELGEGFKPGGEEAFRFENLDGVVLEAFDEGLEGAELVFGLDGLAKLGADADQFLHLVGEFGGARGGEEGGVIDDGVEGFEHALDEFAAVFGGEVFVEGFEVEVAQVA